MRRLRRAALLGLTVVVGAALTLAPPLARPADAREIYVAPPSGAWTINGAGFGHGIGLSQWGAQGAALLGASYSQILGFYYPGTNLGYIGSPTIRVQLTAYSGAAIVFGAYGSEQLIATDLGRGISEALPRSVRYRLRLDATAMHLDQWTGGGWQPLQFHGSFDITGPLDVAGPSGTWVYSADLSGAGRQYWGTLRLLRTGAGTAQAVNVLPMDAYVKFVVPREVPASWHVNALRAQAVAARSYARSVFNPGAAWDICDTTQCQVYGGRAVIAPGGAITWLEHPATSAAVDATGGVVVAFRNAVAFTQYSSSNGGYSVAGSRPYLVAQPDPYSGLAPGDPASRWRTQLSVATLAQHCPPAGSLASFEITGRDGRGPFGGRITAVQVNCTTGSRTITGASALRFGMRSNMWQPVAPAGWNPTGHVDHLAGGPGPGQLRVSGWALDPDTGDPIEVHVYIDGGGHNLGVANLARPDVGRAFPGYGDHHGFDATFTVVPGVYGVCVYAINTGPGANTELTCRQVIVSSSPTGHVDVLAPGPEPRRLRVAGWAIDPNTAAPIPVHVYIDGGGHNLGPANLLRPDVGRAFPMYGDRHGFDRSFPLGAGSHSVCVYAINTGPGTNTLLSCQELTT